MTSDDLRQNINRYIDHTLVKPEATPADIDKLCEEARQFQFAAVCVNTHYVKRCAEQMKGSGVAVGSAIGFPLGATTSEVKAAETRQAIADGASEVDMIINVGELKAGNDAYVENDIRAVVEEAHPKGVLVKVIIETGLLTNEEKTRACKLACSAGADFVKTSTGYGHGGATVEDVHLMQAAVEGKLKVKASGGIRSWQTAQEMVAAGASRLGTSSGVSIMEEALGEALVQAEAGASGKY